jgi:hypothetical protein
MLVPARLDPIEFVTDAQCALRTRVHFGVQVFQQTGRGIERITIWLYGDYPLQRGHLDAWKVSRGGQWFNTTWEKMISSISFFLQRVPTYVQ